ncbi:2-oxo-tetronate isomerase [Methylobacterium durans]|uniref:Hydroxypyruvate isomerase n=1 Tax=Methylobacterium durans TaxID=2202825 RepID=A0A2U8WBA5_9HYPH|nr:2-oxo-tetronate isomerase [Methylobacterium durans]AWN43417.1 hydroxypyruvate isomerase [Methylobacterium durans]
MPRFAANLSLLFTEHPFLDRFAAARDAGFPAVEFLFPYEHAPEAVAQALRLSGLDLVLFNMPPGDWAAGERGLAALPDRFEAVAAGIETALAYAAATGVPRLHLMAGLADRADPGARAAYDRALRHAAERLSERGLDLMIEPINRRSMPGYFLDDLDWAAERVAALRADGHANVGLQCDLFHAQILHGDLTARLARLMPLIGHVQVASVPDRAEPGTGELNDAFLFGELDRLGYSGFVGCEYNPRAGTEAGLSWLAPYRAAPVGEGA